MGRIFTLIEAAEFLRISPNTLRALLNSGKVPGQKAGRAWRLEEDAILRWLGTPAQEAESGAARKRRK